MGGPLREVVETVGHQLSAGYRKLRGFLGLVAADRVTLRSVFGEVFGGGVE